jgi:hypothetical protein
VQGRTRAIPAPVVATIETNRIPTIPTATNTVQPTNIAESLTGLEPRAMPAYYGVKRVQHLHEMLSGLTSYTPGLTGASAVTLSTDRVGASISTANYTGAKSADWAPHHTGYTGNPQFVTFTIPLGLFFSKHPSMYLPIMAVASSQDITIEVRLRDLPSLMQHYHVAVSGIVGTNTTVASATKYQLLSKPRASTKATHYPLVFPEIDTMQLWCHHIQLSQSEADALQLKDQHVRLIKQIQSIKNTFVVMPTGTDLYSTRLDFKIDLSFLHPVQTLWITIRDPDDIAENEYFRYLGKPDDDCRITALDVVINGTSRMSQKIDTDYNMLRLVPLFHNHSKRSYGSDEMTPAVSVDFALNGQSNNPSGHINFSNAATQQLKLDIRGRAGKTYVIDVYAVGLNWVNIQGGTAKVVFN